MGREKYRTLEWKTKFLYGYRETEGGSRRSKGFYSKWDFTFSLDFWQSEIVMTLIQCQYNDRDILDRREVVCSFSDDASTANSIAGDLASVQYIAHGAQDPYFVPPKPSYAMMMRDADLWITTGMDLETWSATLLDKARNRRDHGRRSWFRIGIGRCSRPSESGKKRTGRCSGMNWWIFSEEKCCPGS